MSEDLSLGEAARALDVSVDTLRRWARAGKLQTTRDDANHRRVSREEINRLSPDFIWVGLGTPKQQAWIHQHKAQIKRGVMLGVGFAFDANAGMKPDAPNSMQRRITAGSRWADGAPSSCAPTTIRCRPICSAVREPLLHCPGSRR